MENGRVGSSFEDFLTKEGMRDDVNAVAIKRVLSWQLEQIMQTQSVSKTEMAKRMKTSRSQLDRLLDPNNNAVSLDTLSRAAQAVGRQLRIELV